MKILPTKNQLLQNFLSCANWEEKYMYMMDLGSLLPKFPKKFRTTKYLVTGCQSYTWIVLVKNFICDADNQKKNIINFYGDSDASIVKGIIVIIFSVYQHLDIQSINNININDFLNQLQLTQHLTLSRSQGIYAILNSIYMQINHLRIKG